MKPVYSPCKDPLPYMFGGQSKILEPGGSVFDDEGEARFLVRKFERFGVCFIKVKKGTKKKLDEDAIKEADVVWKEKNRQWAEEVVLDFKAANKEKLDAGIKVDKPESVVKAAKFLGVTLALLLSVLLTSAAAWAQTKTSDNANFAYKYDVASATVTYCRLEGQNSDPFGQMISGRGTVETSGSSVTITGVNAADDVFIDVGVGDLFSVRDSQGNVSNRVVVTNADNDTITVDTAITLADAVWQWKRLVCGTAATNGWIDVGGWFHINLTVQYDAGDVTALSAIWECKGAAVGAAAQRVYPGIASDCGDGTLNGTVCEFTTVGDQLTVNVQHGAFSACRLGVAWVTADGGTRDEITTTIDVAR